MAMNSAWRVPFLVTLVAFIPFAMMVPLWTRTQPTGVSLVRSARRAYVHHGVNSGTQEWGHPGFRGITGWGSGTHHIKCVIGKALMGLSLLLRPPRRVRWLDCKVLGRRRVLIQREPGKPRDDRVGRRDILLRPPLVRHVR